MAEANNYKLLRGRIRALYSTQADFAQALGMSPATLSKKLRHASEWTRAEIVTAAECLDIPIADIPRYFF